MEVKRLKLKKEKEYRMRRKNGSNILEKKGLIGN